MIFVFIPDKPDPFVCKTTFSDMAIDFDLYIKTIKNFFIATGRDGVNSRQKEGGGRRSRHGGHGGGGWESGLGDRNS